MINTPTYMGIFNTYERLLLQLVYVSKTEFEKLKEQFPNLRWTTTNKQKNASRKKRFVEEFPEILKAIEELRK